MLILKSPALNNEINGIDMYISEVSYSDLDNKWQSEDAVSGHTRIYYVVGGKGELHYGGKSVELLPDNVYIIPTGFSYSYSCENKLEKLFCHYNLLRADRTDIFDGIKECIVLKNTGNRAERAVQLWRDGGMLAALELKSMILGDSVKALRLCGVTLGESLTYSSIVSRAIKIIDFSPRMDITANSLAAQLFVSPSRLQKSFRRETGIPLGKYITGRVLFASEALLRSTELSVSEISEQLGFCDQFYFSRVFSGKHGISPAKYRRAVMT